MSRVQPPLAAQTVQMSMGKEGGMREIGLTRRKRVRLNEVQLRRFPPHHHTSIDNLQINAIDVQVQGYEYRILYNYVIMQLCFHLTW